MSKLFASTALACLVLVPGRTGAAAGPHFTDSCRTTITEPGVYHLSHDLTADPACIE